MELHGLLFPALLFIVAMLYSSIGHGGASGYLALMALFSIEPDAMKGSALLLNILVSATAFYQYYRSGHFRWKLFWPFAISSIPAAFLGGMLTVDPVIYKKLLGTALLFAIIRLMGVFGEGRSERRALNFVVALITGVFLGFFSGIIGIGGGIILSPILLLLHWANMKETAAVSALFILVNSAAAFTGLCITGYEFYPQIYVWLVFALLGGMIGSYSGAKKFTSKVLQYILALVLMFASIKLFVF